MVTWRDRDDQSRRDRIPLSNSSSPRSTLGGVFPSRTRGRGRPGWKKGGERLKPYDVDMIRDFLEQLDWEVRVRHFEDTSELGTVNPELVDQLRPFQERRGNVLLAATEIDPEGVSEEEFAEAVATYRAAASEVTGQWIEHLEALQGLFNVALATAAMGPCPRGQMPVNTIKACEILKGDD